MSLNFFSLFGAFIQSSFFKFLKRHFSMKFIEISRLLMVTGNRWASRTTIQSRGCLPGTNWKGASVRISGQGLYSNDQGSLNLKWVSA